MKTSSYHRFHAFIIVFLLTLSACGTSSLSDNEGNATPSDETDIDSSGSAPSTGENIPTDSTNITIQLYSPCPGPDCVEREAYVPPKEVWCQSGFRLCPKKK